MKDKPKVVVRRMDGGPEDEVAGHAVQTVTMPKLAEQEATLLSRAMVYLEKYSRHGRGARCPECGQVIGHNAKCDLAALIAEVEGEVKSVARKVTNQL